MPELPKITILPRQMKAELAGKTLTSIEVLQPKCLNVGVTVRRDEAAVQELADQLELTKGGNQHDLLPGH